MPSGRSWNSSSSESSIAGWKRIRSFFDFFVEGCQFKPVVATLRGGRMIELVDTSAGRRRRRREYKRLLGYPRDCGSKDRARELADAARAPGTPSMAGPGFMRGSGQSRNRRAASICIDGVSFAQRAIADDAARGRGRVGDPRCRQRRSGVGAGGRNSCGRTRSPTSISFSKSMARPSSST